MRCVKERIASRSFGIALSDLDGLAKRTPWLGFALLVFLLSLAGIPFAVGFWAKLFMFMVAYRSGHIVLVLFGTLMSIVALFYYLGIARAAFIQPPTGAPEAAPVSKALAAAIVLCLVGVLGMGIYPSPFVNGATRAADALFAELK